MKTTGHLVLPHVQFGRFLSVYRQGLFARLGEEQVLPREVMS